MVLCDLIGVEVNHIKCGREHTVHRVGFVSIFARGIQISQTIPECTDVLFPLLEDGGKSCSLHIYSLLSTHRSKRGFKAEGGVERRLIRSPQTYLRCVFSPLNPLCLSLSDSYILLCCSLKLMQRKPQSLRRQQAAACHLFFNADNILSDEGLGLTGRKSLSCGISRHCIK